MKEGLQHDSRVRAPFRDRPWQETPLLDRDDFQNGLRLAYRDERMAVITLSRILPNIDKATDVELAQCFIALEQAVGDCLEPLLQRYGLPTEILTADGLAAQLRGDALGRWAAVTETLDQRLDAYVETFRTLRDYAPTADRPVFDMLIDHELAIITFGSLLRQGRDEAALQQITAILKRAKVLANSVRAAR